MYLLIVFLPLLGSSIAGFFGRFLGLGSDGHFIILLALVLCSLIFLFRRYSFQLKEKYGFGLLVLFWHFFILFGVGILGSLLRIYLLSRLGLDFTYIFPPILYSVGLFSVGAGLELPEQGPSEPSSPTTSFFSGVSAEIEKKFGFVEGESSSKQTEVAGPSHLNQNSPPMDQDHNEKMARIREIHEAYEQIEDKIVELRKIERMQMPGGFKTEKMVEMFEDKYGAERMLEIAQDMEEKGLASKFYTESKSFFNSLKKEGVTEKMCRDRWNGKT